MARGDRVVLVMPRRGMIKIRLLVTSALSFQMMTFRVDDNGLRW